MCVCGFVCVCVCVLVCVCVCWCVGVDGLSRWLKCPKCREKENRRFRVSFDVIKIVREEDIDIENEQVPYNVAYWGLDYAVGFIYPLCPCGVCRVLVSF